MAVLLSRTGEEVAAFEPAGGFFSSAAWAAAGGALDDGPDAALVERADRDLRSARGREQVLAAVGGDQEARARSVLDLGQVDLRDGTGGQGFAQLALGAAEPVEQVGRHDWKSGLQG